jgi:hypothetical protein
MSTTEAASERVERTRKRVDKFHKWRAERELRAYADEQAKEAEPDRDQASRYSNACRRNAGRNNDAFAFLGEQTPEPDSRIAAGQGCGATTGRHKSEQGHPRVSNVPDGALPFTRGSRREILQHLAVRGLWQPRLESFGCSGAIALLVPNHTECACAQINGDQRETSGLYVRTSHQVRDHGQMGARANRHADGFVGRQFKGRFE